MDRPWQLDPIPLLIARGGVARDRGGRRAARARCSIACSPISTARSGCCATGSFRRSSCSRNPGFLRPCHGLRRRRRALPARLRRRSRALAGRPLVGARRPHAGAVGRGLRAREPRRALAHPARAVPRLPRPAPRGLLPRSARRARRARAARRRLGRASCSSRPGRTTRPTSSTPIWRATSASRSSKAPISRCATSACS